ncbi:hypothetical protein Fmac_010222 [Flemingia macrophylla]|uniref:Uncharacterized protein n=1 Tax=Flemingia macrophylla TaxID=520843 RepID=A0ABD1N2F5_9FABA
MKSADSVTGFVLPDPKNRLFLWSFIIMVSLISVAYFVGNAVYEKEYKQIGLLEFGRRLARWGLIHTIPDSKPNACKRQCLPIVSEALPEGIIARTSNLEMRPLWGSGKDNTVRNWNRTYLAGGKSTVYSSENTGVEVKSPLDSFSCYLRILKGPSNLLAMAVGVKQKEIVNKIVEKFLSSDFVVMLFHYDGIVDGWKTLAWSNRAIHISANNQTKWWFAKRFLHPDIVAEYNYIFLWDEDLLVDNFDPKSLLVSGMLLGPCIEPYGRYLSIVKEERLEISQPALDPIKSEVHHPLTVHKTGSKVHSWVEMMAPVFSKKSWQCVWHLIQNDLIHAWGLDRQLGYCAQGDRMQNVGVVDTEYIVHLGLPTLGGSNGNEASDFISRLVAPSGSPRNNARAKVRMQSYIEMQVFGKRWKDAAKRDKCWIDPYEQQANQTSH